MKTVIIGSGIAGLSCALETASRGGQVLLVSPLASERAESVLAAGGINAALTEGPDDDALRHAEDTIRSAHGLEPEADIRELCRRGPELLRWLESKGVVFSRDAQGQLARRPFGGQSAKRTAYAGSATGKQLVTALVQACREQELQGRIARRTGVHFYSALIRDGACYGAILCEDATGRLEAVTADRVVMATGGQNALFGKTTGSRLCDGYAAARLWEQGAVLRNLEMIQFHPTSMETAQKRMLISEAARGEGGRLFYVKNGERCYFLEEKYGPKGNLMPRDVIAREMVACGQPVFLDISFLPEETIRTRLAEPAALCRTYLGLDVTREPIPVVPSVHFFMGGLQVDSRHRTGIRGLYAIGECASKYHGANRLGGNSLLAAVYGGRVAAESTEAVTGPGFSAAELASLVAREQERLDRLRCSDLTGAELELKDAAEVVSRAMAIVRCGEGLENGLRELERLRRGGNARDGGEPLPAYECYRREPLLRLAEAMLLSAQARRESRGAHLRSDYPEPLAAFEAASLARLGGNGIEIAFEQRTGEEQTP